MPIHGFTKEVKKFLFFFFAAMLFFAGFGLVMAQLGYGISFYLFIYLAAYSCSMELCLDSNSERKLKYIDYFMHRIHMLRHNKITPVVVFDGGNVPCKAATGDERHRHVSLIFFCTISIRISSYLLIFEMVFVFLI